jgi:drug/metabolite transporter (DMT)-like permease
MFGQALAIGCALSWAVSVVLFKRASSGVTAHGMNLYKNTVALVLLGVTLAFMGRGFDAERDAWDWATLAVSGIVGIAVADTLYLSALQRMDAGLLAIVECVYTPAVIALSVWWLRETPSPAFLAGATLVVGGVALALGAGRRSAGAPLGAVAQALVAVLCMAVAVTMAKPALNRGDLVEVTTVRLLAGTAALALFVAARRDRARHFVALRPGRASRGLFVAAVVGTYVSMILWLGGLKYTDVHTAATLNQLTTVFTIGFARLALGEPLTPVRVFGGAASLAGGLLVVSAT